jgi:tripartite ATP-independent transporter DctM subunit
MTPLLWVAAIFGVMLLLMAVRTPIAIAMFCAGTVGYGLQSGWSPLASFLNNQTFARFASYDLSVIPLFLLMGNLATQGGLSRALFAFASTVMARFQGGLAMAAVLASAAFGSICGSSVATAATITSVALPEMRRHGYSGRLATGTLAAGGTLGILIPPSVPLVIYAILAEQNIAKLFAAALIPGIVAMLGYMLAIALYVRLYPGHAPAKNTSQNPAAPATPPSWTGVMPILIVFLVVFGGIYGGLFTPTEGAAVGVATTFLAAVIRRELTWAKMAESCYATAQGTAMIFLIFVGADLMNAALALTQVPSQLAGLVQSWSWPPLMVVTAILLFYVVLGAVMDELSMLLLTIPIFFPIVNALDFGMPQEMAAIWFGILVLMTVGFGMLAPPVGLNVYVVNSMAKDVPIAESYRGVMPFLISDTLRMVLLVLCPGITLWLVSYVT